MIKRRALNEKLDEILRRPYTIEIEYGETPEEGVAAYVAEWPGCITAGGAPVEAAARIGGGMRGWGRGRPARKARGGLPPPGGRAAGAPRPSPRAPTSGEENAR